MFVFLLQSWHIFWHYTLVLLFQCCTLSSRYSLCSCVIVGLLRRQYYYLFCSFGAVSFCCKHYSFWRFFATVHFPLCYIPLRFVTVIFPFVAHILQYFDISSMPKESQQTIDVITRDVKNNIEQRKHKEAVRAESVFYSRRLWSVMFSCYGVHCTVWYQSC